MDAGTVKLLEFLSPRKSVFRIPVYQRRYEWTEEQVDQFFYDIERLALNQQLQGHFMGTVVFVKSSFPGMGSDYIIIDGQQRITTAFLLLKALFDSIEDEHTCIDIQDSYFENQNVEDAYKYKLISVEEDRRDFINLLVHRQSDRPSKIQMNYKRLLYLIQHSQASSEEIYEALQKIRIVYIELEQGRKEENPQVIFESLNSTGLSLTESDLIRNYLLMNEQPEKQEHLYKNYWLHIEERLTNAKISDFIRDYLTMKTGQIPNKNKVYQSFKAYMAEVGISSADILNDLLVFSNYYRQLLNAEHKNKRAQNYLSIIIDLKSTVTYPYLLRLFHEYEQGNIQEEQFLNVLKLINSYLIRRAIVSYPTSSLNKVFSALGKEAEKVKEQKTELEAVAAYLYTRTGKAVFPRDEIVKESVLNSDMYNRNTRLVKLILTQIERESHKEVIEFDEVTVEHIMPRTLTPSWRVELGDRAIDDHKLYVHVLGNLTLTSYNSELSNKTFEEKLAYYEKSNIQLTRDCAQYLQWNKESILQRGQQLYESIIAIWPCESEPYDDKKNRVIEADTYYSVFESLKVTGKKPKSLWVEEQEYSVSTWREVLEKYLAWLADFDLEQYQALPKQKAFQKLLSYDETVHRQPIEWYGIYVETNLSAQSIYNFVSSLAEFYDMEDSVYLQLNT